MQNTQSSTACMALPAMSHFPVGKVRTSSFAVEVQCGKHQQTHPKFTVQYPHALHSSHSVLVLPVIHRRRCFACNACPIYSSRNISCSYYNAMRCHAFRCEQSGRQVWPLICCVASAGRHAAMSLQSPEAFSPLFLFCDITLCCRTTHLFRWRRKAKLPVCRYFSMLRIPRWLKLIPSPALRHAS